MKIGIYQGPPLGGDAGLQSAQDINAAFHTLACTLKACALAGAEMVVFPELFLPGYNQPQLHPRMAQPQGGTWERQFAQLAAEHQCGLVIGWAELAGADIYNAASAYGPDGAKLAHYRKIQLFGPQEKAVFTPGDRYASFQFRGHHIGLLICYDIEFAQHAWALKARGVDLVLVPTANPAGFENVSDLIVPARAAENALAVAYANYCSTEGNLRYGGGSVIVDANGASLARAGQGPALLIADLGGQAPGLSTQHTDFRAITPD